MKSITIHKIDDQTEEVLTRRAREEGVSLNSLIKKIIRQSMGTAGEAGNRREDFAGFCGRWTDQEAQEFGEATAVFGELDEEVWK